MKFRKKPVVIDAKQFKGHNTTEVLAWCNDSSVFENDGLYIRTLEGIMRVSAGDWVIRGVAGEYYPCRDDIFRATYEEADDA